MFVNEVNDFKIYNLSAGKSIPEWLTDRRKRSKFMKQIDSRRQIELIQDFNMPGVCTTIKMSPDKQYILAAGTYKPRLKCFEVCNLSIKFERCFDSDITTFESISDDYRKLVFLHCDRFIEIHTGHGRHFRLRIPRFGRDMKYHKPSCDLYIVGTSKDIYRLNLERGQFLQPYETNSTCINACDANVDHQMLMVGTGEGTVEAWDPRSRTRCATLDVAMKLPDAKIFPSVSALKFKNALEIGVGTNSGHVLLYDIRSRHPLIIKDHLNRTPIKRIDFNPAYNAVYSLDEAMLKIWNEENGKQMAYIESTTLFNDFCTIPGTGIFFLGQEDIKMLTYYIPALGAAPRWCSFLDNITDEIESEVVENMYDDYHFVTLRELEELGLDHLIGTNLLKGYMHGYFVDVRLYNKAKAFIEPFAFDRYRKEKIRKEIEKTRQPRFQINKQLPKVNQEVALKFLQDSERKSSKKAPNLLEDKRFSAMFENPDFTINKNIEEYKMLAPALNRLEKSQVKDLKRRIEVAHVNELHADEEHPHGDSDNDEDLFGFDKVNNAKDDSSRSDESSDDEDERNFAKDMKKAYRSVKRQREEEEAAEAEDGDEDAENKDGKIEIDRKWTIDVKNIKQKVKMVQPSLDKKTKLEMTALENADQFNTNCMDGSYMLAATKLSLENRVRIEEECSNRIDHIGNTGNRQMTFEVRTAASRHSQKRANEMKVHREERRKLIRPTNSLKLKRVNFK